MVLSFPKSYTKQLCCAMCMVVLIALLAYVVYYFKSSKPKEAFSGEGGGVKTLIFFKANWCGHCNRFKPVWDEFVSECKAKNEPTQLLELDIDEEATKPLMQKHNVRGFPHVVLTGENQEDVVFTKNRTKEDLFAFLTENA